MLNDYDHASKVAAKHNSSGYFRWLLGASVRLVFREWYDTALPPLPGDEERTCDTVALFDDPDDPTQPVAIDLEFQTENDSEILERELEYIARLRRALRRSGYRVIGALVNLTGAPQRDTLEMTLPGRPEIGLRMRIVLSTLREEDAAATLEGIATGKIARCILSWIPLMRGAGELAIIEKWKELASAEPDTNYHSDYGLIARIFPALTKHYTLWDQSLKGWNMLESPVMKEIRTEGRLQTQRDNLLQAIELQFEAPVPADLAARITTSTDLEELRRWFVAVFSTATIDEYRTAIGV